jgi:5-methylcytosine-specific restriction endonuclease McrA
VAQRYELGAVALAESSTARVWVADVRARRRASEAVSKFLARQFSINAGIVPCAYCGRLLTREVATVDHVVPLCVGGANVGNRVVACRDCNTLKGDMNLENFRTYVEEIARHASRWSHWVKIYLHLSASKWREPQ